MMSKSASQPEYLILIHSITVTTGHDYTSRTYTGILSYIGQKNTSDSSSNGNYIWPVSIEHTLVEL